LVTIKSGYPFRSLIKQIDGGNIKLVQPRDINHLGELQTTNLVTTELPGKRQPDFLQAGDILFINKGSRNIACCVTSAMENTTLSPALLLLRLKPEYKTKVNSLFLTWQLNSLTLQNYFKRRAEGSLHLGIRASVLAKAPIMLPAINKQQTIAKLYQANLKQQQLLAALVANNKQQLQAIDNLIKD
jgi:restriction endonuclease S subunit